MNNNCNCKNQKKLLCCKTILKGKCFNMNKCSFAHNLIEQKKTPIRNFVHSLITDNKTNNVNIFTNREIFEELMIHTKLCKQCQINLCTGGYNCKFGACHPSLLICQNDLLSGNCENKVCCKNGIHLTNKGLIPFLQRSLSNNILSSYPIVSSTLDNKEIKGNYHYKIDAISIILNDDNKNNLYLLQS